MNAELDFEKHFRLVREIVETLVLTLVMFLIIRFAVQNYFVDGMSMEPTLHNKELILVDKWTYMLHKPARGDVIIFHAPPQPGVDYVKRVVGLPGDRISVNGTVVSVNGATLNETYVDPARQGNPFASFSNKLIPPNSLFVLGDNRNGSSDSRDWGFVPEGNIVGRAALVYWPLGQDNSGFLKNVSAVYTSIPAAGKVPAQNSRGMPPLNIALLLILPIAVRGMRSLRRAS